MKFGPYLVFSNGEPQSFWYMETTQSTIDWYKTPYPCTDAENARWEPTPFPEQIYLIDPSTTPPRRFCYFKEEDGKIYEGIIDLEQAQKNLAIGEIQEIKVSGENLTKGHPQPSKSDKSITYYEKPNALITPTLPKVAVAKHHNPKGLANALTILQEKNLLTGELGQANFDAVVNHPNPISVAKALVRLQKANLLTSELVQANRDAVVKHDDPFVLAIALAILQKTNLLTGKLAQANFDAVVNHQKLVSVAKALVRLQKANLLTGELDQANFDAVAKHHEPDDLDEALTILQQANLLTGEPDQANFDAVAKHYEPSIVACALESLQKANLLTGELAQANRDAVAKHHEPYDLYEALTILQQANLLTGEPDQANFDAVAKHHKPSEVADALAILQEENLSTGEFAQANRDAVVEHDNPFHLARALIILQKANLLTGELAQDNYAAVVNHPEPMGVAKALYRLHSPFYDEIQIEQSAAALNQRSDTTIYVFFNEQNKQHEIEYNCRGQKGKIDISNKKLRKQLEQDHELLKLVIIHDVKAKAIEAKRQDKLPVFFNLATRILYMAISDRYPLVTHDELKLQALSSEATTELAPLQRAIAPQSAQVLNIINACKRQAQALGQKAHPTPQALDIAAQHLENLWRFFEADEESKDRWIKQVQELNQFAKTLTEDPHVNSRKLGYLLIGIGLAAVILSTFIAITVFAPHAIIPQISQYFSKLFTSPWLPKEAWQIFTLGVAGGVGLVSLGTGAAVVTKNPSLSQSMHNLFTKTQKHSKKELDIEIPEQKTPIK